jgi:uncharacterized membrane protein
MQLNRVKLSYWMALTGYFGLIIGIYVWHMWIKNTPAHQMSIMLIVQLGPLMFPLRGLLAGRIYTHAWAMYLAIFYFVLGVWYAGADEDVAFGMYTIASSMLFFAGTLFYTRYASRQAADSAGKPPIDHS